MPTPHDPYVHEPTEQYINERLEEAETHLTNAHEMVFDLICRDRIIHTEDVEKAASTAERAAFELRCLIAHR